MAEAKSGADMGVSQVSVRKSRSGAWSCSRSEISVECLVRKQVLRNVQESAECGGVSNW